MVQKKHQMANYYRQWSFSGKKNKTHQKTFWPEEKNNALELPGYNSWALKVSFRRFHKLPDFGKLSKNESERQGTRYVNYVGTFRIFRRIKIPTEQKTRYLFSSNSNVLHK